MESAIPFHLQAEPSIIRTSGLPFEESYFTPNSILSFSRFISLQSLPALHQFPPSILPPDAPLLKK
jgi:hypothetical protein